MLYTVAYSTASYHTEDILITTQMRELKRVEHILKQDLHSDSTALVHVVIATQEDVKLKL